ncbi:MAG: phosphomannomutase/phosphoglucomutase [Clostridia bacterium]|nr:phosphomannomutase/phosphoglucomutase [Clostridia bacterium]MBO4886359.1 phosphomannomutase/phosphoglucomutase [Clostridia bacterium]
MRSEWMKLKSGSDIRGDAMEHDGIRPLLTVETAECVGYAFALWLARKTNTTSDKLTIAVGHDSRLTGPALKDGIIRGLTAADCDVLDCGLCTTPAMFITTVEPETNCDGAVMITASHHPWYRNGFKLITREGGLEGGEIGEILAAAMDVTLPQRLVKPVDFLSIYTGRLAGMVRERLEDDALRPLLGLHVVVDAGNGAGGFYAEFLKELGADVEGSQYLDPDGHFPNHIPNPEDKDAMAAVCRAVRESGADLGVIFDTDCDRAAIVDEQGHEINRNRLIALISAILLNEKPGQTIVTDSVTSSGLAKFIAEWGGTHYRFKRGYRNVINEAIRLNEEGIECPLAIETSGHAALRENFFLDDGMYLVTRLICEAMERKRQGLTLGSLIDDLAEPLESVEVRMNILDEDFRTAGQSVIETILSKTLDDPTWHLAPDNREGVRISFDLDGGVDNAWFLLRLSVHDPVMPLNAESDVKGGVQFMLNNLYALLEGTEALDLAPLKKLIEG